MSKYLLTLLFSISFMIGYSQCSSCPSGSTNIDGVTNINEQNNAADYCIDGVWNGTIQNIADGSTVTICPSSTWNLPSNISLSKNVTIENYGSITDNGNGLKIFMQGQLVLINKSGGMITVDQFENQDADFINGGTLTADDIYLHGPSTNSGTINSTADCGGTANTSCGFFIGNKGQPFNNIGTVNTIDATIQDQIIGGGIFNSTGNLDLTNNSGMTDNIFNLNNINIGASSNVTTGTFFIGGIINCNNANITTSVCFLTGGAYGTDCSSGTPMITTCPTLPVDFIDFTVVKSTNNVLLTWEVETEINVDYYEILKSHNGIDYSSLAKVDARSDKYYQYQYLPRQNTDTYYKIKNVDLDGSESIYNKIEFIKGTKSENIKVYPNPSSKDEVLIIRLDRKDYNNVSVSLYDVNGRLVINNIYNDWIQNEIKLDLNKVNHTGIFTLQIHTGNETYIEKVFIK